MPELDDDGLETELDLIDELDGREDDELELVPLLADFILSPRLALVGSTNTIEPNSTIVNTTMNFLKNFPDDIIHLPFNNHIKILTAEHHLAVVVR
jgi:hypothetical protein